MRRAKAKAIAIQNPYAAAAVSMKNFAVLMVDFMYGTKERARMTALFATALAVLGCIMGVSEMNALQACAV